MKKKVEIRMLYVARQIIQNLTKLILTGNMSMYQITTYIYTVRLMWTRIQ